MGFLGIDNSDAGQLPDYSRGLNGISDAVTEVMRRREQKRQFDAEQLLAKEAQARLKAQHADQMKHQDAALRQRDQHHQDDMAAKGMETGRKGVYAVQEAAAAGNPQLMAAAAAAHGLQHDVSNPEPAPERPVAPQRPQAPERGDVALPGPFRAIPPELRAMMAAGARAAAEQPPAPEPSDQALEAMVPQQQRPRSTQPPPQGGDEVDRFLADDAAQELKTREMAGSAFRGFQASSDQHKSEMEEAVRAAVEGQGQKELAFSNENAAFPAKQQRFQQESAAFPAAQKAHERAAVHTVVLPNGQRVPISVAEQRDAPRAQSAEELRAAHLPRIEAAIQQEQQILANPQMPREARARAKGRIEALMAEASNVERVAANLEAGGGKPIDAGQEIRESQKFETGERNKREMNVEDNTAAEKRARIAASRAMAIAGGTDANRDRTNSRLEAKYADEIEKTMRDKVLLMAPKDQQRFHQTKQSIKKVLGNPLQQKAAMYAIGKEINGPGVFTNFDKKDILNYGGLGAKLGNWIQQLADGRLGDEYLGIAAQAINNQIQVVDQRMRTQSQIWDRRVAEDPDLQTPEMQARMAARKNALFGAFGQAPEEVPAVEPGGAVIGRRGSAGSSQKFGATGPDADTALDTLHKASGGKHGKAKAKDPDEEFLNGLGR
jgi:hypothetical protein